MTPTLLFDATWLRLSLLEILSFVTTLLPCLPRSALSALHPQLPVLMVIMATRQRSIAFPHIDIVAAQQRALQLPGLFKLEMTGFEFYPMDVGLPGGEAELVHLTKAGCAALGVAMGYLVASKDGLQCSS